MRFINVRLNTIEELPDNCDVTITDSEQLGFLPGRCKPGREYTGTLDTLPFVDRKPYQFISYESTNGLRGREPIRWAHEFTNGVQYCYLCHKSHLVWPRPESCPAYQY